MKDTITKFATEQLSETESKEIPTELKFGTIFSDRMFIQKYSPELGWHDKKITAFNDLTLSPAAVVFHYGQAIFEGVKAYRREDGDINLFRLEENLKRFNRSAERLAMPSVDVDEHYEAIVELIKLDSKWVPNAPGSSLYIRPTMIGSEPMLGIHSSKEYLHFVILSPVGAYFKEGFNPISVYVSDDHVRAVQGGTGHVKASANYAGTLVVAKNANKLGYEQVLWLDAKELKYVEEVGAMNIAFVYEGSHIITPSLTGSILPGINRDSVLKIAPRLGYTISEEKIEIDTVIKDIQNGKITEVFGMGTAAVIAPIGKLGYKGQDSIINDGVTGPVAKRLYDTVTGLQYGQIADEYGFTYTIRVS